MVKRKANPIKEELKSTKEDLEELERYVEEFLAFLPLAVCSVNPIGIIIDINKSFEELTGYKPIEIVGESLIKIFLEKEEAKKISKEALKKKISRGRELTLISKKEEKIPISVSASIRRDEKGDLVGYFVGIIDISKSKKLQEKLEKKVKERTKELEERMRELERTKEREMVLRIRERAKTRDIERKVEELEKTRKALMNMLEDTNEERRKAEEEKNKTSMIITNFADGLMVFDKENKLSLINRQAEGFFDIKSRDIVGRSILELNTFPTIKPIVQLIGKEMKGIFRKEVQLKRDLILELSTIPIIKKDEKLGVLITLHDITREKRIEKMKTEFVSLSAHQLRTPLSAVKWTLKMLLDGDLGKITKEEREFIWKSYKSNERMINLVNDLLDVTRIEEGRYLYKPVLTDLEPICQFMINSYKEEIEKKKLKVEFKKPKKKLPKVKIDIEKIKLAIQNLLENAIRYNQTGGKIIISLAQKGKEIEFSIKDTGIGISKDQQSRIFTKFFRGSNAIRMETEGSGLGLFITKNIIEAHGGKVWFESEEGKGTTFYFTLPVKGVFGEFLKEF